MSDFEFYIAFYGLLLGLSVAEVANKFLNVIGARRRLTIGWLTPALAIFLFLDITSFWIYAWGARETIAIGWQTMFFGLLVALSYYFAAGLALPRDSSEWTDLDEYYWQHKRFVVGGILVPNLIVFAHGLVTHGAPFDAVFWFNQSTYYPPLLLLLVTRKHWIDLALFGVLIVSYIVAAFLPSWLL